MSSFKKPEAGKAFVKLLLFGTAGTGKTHGALTFSKPAVVDTEGGTAFFADRVDFTSVEERGYKAILGLIDEVEHGNVDCDTFIIDSVTSVYNVLQLALSDDGNKALRPMDWGILKARFKAMLDFSYDALPKHVVFTAHEKAEYAREGQTVDGRVVKANELVTIGYIPDCDRKVEHTVDFVFRTTFDEGKYWWTCIKSRSDAFKKGMRYPAQAWADFAKIVAGGSTKVNQTDSQAAKAEAQTLTPQDVEYDAGDMPKGPTLAELAQETIDLTKTLGIDTGAFLTEHTGKPSTKGVVKAQWVTMLGILHDEREKRAAAPVPELVAAAAEAGLIAPEPVAEVPATVAEVPLPEAPAPVAVSSAAQTLPDVPTVTGDTAGSSTKAQRSQVHGLKVRLEWDDVTYQGWLHKNFGVLSSTKLTETQAEIAIKQLVALVPVAVPA